MELRQLMQDIPVIGHSAFPAGDVSSVCYAANQCRPGSLFVAIAGLAHDGHDFIGQAVKRGAHFIVHQKDILAPEGVVAIRVSDSRRALGMLGRNYFCDPSAGLTLIGITGTSGKTTVTYLLESILTAAGLRCGVLGTVNYRYSGKVLPAPNTTPESFEMQKILREMADAGVTHVIAEVSSHALDLKRVDDCEFDIGIFTNLSPEHLDYHKDMDDYFRAKKRFFTELLPLGKKNHLPKAVINADDEWGQKLISEIKIPVRTFGIKGEVTVQNEKITLDGIRAEMTVSGKTIAVSSGLIGSFNLSNILAAVAAASALRVEPSVIEAGIRNVSFVPGRLERVASSAGIHVFVDYAHKPDALNQVLKTLLALKQRRIITVFGCGGNRDRTKRPVMGHTATTYSDLTIVTSDNPRLEAPQAIIAEIEAGIDQHKIKKMPPDNLISDDKDHRYAVIADRKTAIDCAIGLAQAGDIVLIAGKGHEDYQILGTEKVPFDDRLVAAQALKARG
jgi:UDP-N-acetylmuramoyl-L-alanyl-D-glutamate--2,6-diaminopimelate ligase